MKKYLLMIPVFLVLSVGLVGCSNYGNKSSNSALVSTNSVSIANFAFNPQNISVAAGTEVTFTNNDSTAHTVTFDSFKSDNLAPGATYKHTFDSAGTFNYHCSIHPSMTGTIEVK